MKPENKEIVSHLICHLYEIDCVVLVTDDTFQPSPGSWFSVSNKKKLERTSLKKKSQINNPDRVSAQLLIYIQDTGGGQKPDTVGV